MVKCACGCGKEIPEGAPKVGVPTGEGDFIAYFPEHHLGPQVACSSGDGGVCEPVADNPKITSVKQMFDDLNDDRSHGHEEVAEAANKIYKTYKGRDPEEFFRLTMREAARMEGHNPKKMTLWIKMSNGASFGPFASQSQAVSFIEKYPFLKGKIESVGGKSHRKNALPIGQIAKMAGVKGEVKASIGNPSRPTAEFWRKTYFPIYWYYRKQRGFSADRAKKAASGTTASIWHYKISPSKKRGYEALRRLREGRGKIGINSAGTINVDGSRITEVRYVEHGTGQKWRHKLVHPVRMRVKGGKVHVPPMAVRPEGIVQ